MKLRAELDQDMVRMMKLNKWIASKSNKQSEEQRSRTGSGRSVEGRRRSADDEWKIECGLSFEWRTHAKEDEEEEEIGAT
jgi:hypothetical protein